MVQSGVGLVQTKLIECCLIHGYNQTKDCSDGTSVVREALEVDEFVPRQPVEAARVDYPDSTGHIWSRLRLERRTLRSCCAALASTSANFAPVRNHTSLERNGERLL